MTQTVAPPMTLPDVLNGRMHRARIGSSYLAREADVTPNRLHTILAGDRSPTTTELHAIAAVLDRFAPDETITASSLMAEAGL